MASPTPSSNTTDLRLARLTAAAAGQPKPTSLNSQGVVEKAVQQQIAKAGSGAAIAQGTIPAVQAAGAAYTSALKGATPSMASTPPSIMNAAQNALNQRWALLGDRSQVKVDRQNAVINSQRVKDASSALQQKLTDEITNPNPATGIFTPALRTALQNDFLAKGKASDLTGARNILSTYTDQKLQQLGTTRQQLDDVLHTYFAPQEVISSATTPNSVSQSPWSAFMPSYATPANPAPNAPTSQGYSLNLSKALKGLKVLNPLNKLKQVSSLGT